MALDMGAAKWWHAIFASTNIVGLIVGAIYQIFISNIKCKMLCSWLITHGCFCLLYYIFMFIFTLEFKIESKELEEKFTQSTYKMKQIMESLGFEEDKINTFEGEQTMPNQKKNGSIRIYPIELASFIFLCLYIISLCIGIYFVNKDSCDAWLTYMALPIIVISLFLILFNGYRSRSTIYTKWKKLGSGKWKRGSYSLFWD